MTSSLLRQKEQDDIAHLQGAVMDGCMCDLCIACRSIIDDCCWKAILETWRQAAMEVCERCRIGMPDNPHWFHDNCSAFDILERMREHEQTKNK